MASRGILLPRAGMLYGILLCTVVAVAYLGARAFRGILAGAHRGVVGGRFWVYSL